MKNSFANDAGLIIVTALIATIHQSRDYLSAIDGEIGDGDHGVNMDKGFQLVAGRLEESMSMSDALKILGKTLLMEIGGSMGPLYGHFFRAMARLSKGKDDIDLLTFTEMIEAAYTAIHELGEARPGDKTIVDTLAPAASALRKASNENLDFSVALDQMVEAAEEGWKSTEDMVAKIGRSARLGERSRGVLDAGATSCFLMLKTMADEIKVLLA